MLERGGLLVFVAVKAAGILGDSIRPKGFFLGIVAKGKHHAAARDWRAGREVPAHGVQRKGCTASIVGTLTAP